MSSKSACGKYETISYAMTMEKYFFCICGFIFGCGCLVIGRFNNKKYVFISTIGAASFSIFFIALSYLQFEIQPVSFFLIFTSSTSKFCNISSRIINICVSEVHPLGTEFPAGLRFLVSIRIYHEADYSRFLFVPDRICALPANTYYQSPSYYFESGFCKDNVTYF